MKCDEIFAALAMLEKERGISQTFMMDKIVQALTTAYKRDHEGVENVIVDVDEAKRDLKMYVQKEVVEEVENPGTQMSLEDAKKLSAKYEVGSIVNLPVDNVEFGRIAAGNGKQVIIQGLREAESGMVYEEYNSKQHEILTGVVTRIDPRNGSVALRIGTGAEATDAILTAGEQVKGETLVEGQRIKVYLVDVRRQSRGPQVVISRTHPGLVKRLFELEVPEIYDGTVEIRSIAREAGSRTKMAVWSNDANVDPIGACVGPRGQRVNNIVEELRGEKIDIIKYSDDPAEYIAAALAPADVVENPGTQMSLEDAKKLSAKYEVGSIVNLPVDNVEFGRIAAGNGKQVIIQGLREAESGMVYEEYNSKQHEILTGVVTRIDPRNGSVALRIGTGAEATDAILTAGEQVKGETLVEGQRIKVYLVDVRRQSRGPQVVISRTHPGLVKRLFELEVPEIYDGTVEIRSIAREAGSRTKMAVWSNDANVDPIGACVGPRGQRVNNIVEELRGEKIDIIKYSDDPAEYIAAALAPADVVEVRMADDGSKACRVIVPDDQLSLAIGKEGQNARLAARLVGYKIDIKPKSYKDEE